MSTKHLSKGSIIPPFVHGNIRLYSMRFCPYAQRIHLILDMKQIQYDVVYVNLAQQPEWFLSKSPCGRVPFLEFEEGDTCYDSIAEYLDGFSLNNKLYPTNPLALIRDKLLIKKFNKVITNMYKLYTGTTIDKKVFNKVLSNLEFYNRELRKRKTTFFSGDSPGIVDLMIWPWCERADVIRILWGDKFIIPRKRFLRLFKWRNAMKKDPVVKKNYLDAEVHAKYICSLLAGMPQYDTLVNV